MAKLKSYRRDSIAIRDGQWVDVGEEGAEFQIKVRGYSPSYWDAMNAAIRAASKKHGGQEKIPTEVANEITRELFISRLLLGVAGLESDESDSDMPLDEFTDLLRDEDYQLLVVACLKGVAEVGRIREDDKEEAAKN